MLLFFRATTIFYLFVLVITSCAVPIENSQYRLQYNLKEGQQYSYTMSVDMNINQEMMGQQMNISTTIESPSTITISEEGEQYGFSAKFGEMSMSMIMMDMPPQEMAVNMDFLTSKMVINKQGKVLRDTVMIDEEKSSNPQVVQSVKDQASQFSGRTFIEFPEKELKPGDTWKVEMNDTTSPMGGVMLMNGVVTYTFQAVVDTLGKKCARIALVMDEGTVEMDMNVQGSSMSGDGDMYMDGVSYVELENGMTLHSVMKQDMDVRMAVTGQQNMIIVMNIGTSIGIQRN
jgi:hypothetical protein